MECLKQGVDVRFAVEEAQVYCDSNQMKQVILNVMKNALEAMQDGGLLNVQLENDGHIGSSEMVMLDTNFPPDVIEYIIRRCASEGVPLTIIPVSAPKVKHLPDSLEGVTWLCPAAERDEGPGHDPDGCSHCLFHRGVSDNHP